MLPITHGMAQGPGAGDRAVPPGHPWRGPAFDAEDPLCFSELSHSPGGDDRRGSAAFFPHLGSV